MITRGRVISALVVLVLAVVAYSGYLAYRIQSDLREAQSSATALRVALEDDDRGAQDTAVQKLTAASQSAASNSGGFWWKSLEILPLIGDDAEGIRVLSESLEVVSRDGVTPLLGTVDSLDGLTDEGRVDLDLLASLETPVAEANDAFGAAANEVEAVDSTGFIGVFGTQFDDYAEQLIDIANGLESADRAIGVLPTMLGADGNRAYLLLFQNNAEVRPLAGQPGSWARMTAEDGRLEIARQGSASEMEVTDEPILPISDEELNGYGEQYGTFFFNPGFNPDFPRAAELWRAHYENNFPGERIDGVIALDVPALGYLAEGTGAIPVRDRTLTADNMVFELLSRPYLEIEDPSDQDAFFAEAARAIFAKATAAPENPIALLEGFSRAAGERRFLVASFGNTVREELAGSAIEGTFSEGDGDSPDVAVTFSDATGSKMSYYLRYNSEVTAQSCDFNQQRIAGTVRMRQDIQPNQAVNLPVYVTGGGSFGTEPGRQTVFTRIYAPIGGTLDSVAVNGEPVDLSFATRIDNRDMVQLSVELDSRDDVVVTYQATAAEGQRGAVESFVTPGIMPGSPFATSPSAC